ncbi:hypothetical protein GCK72_016665 [Caenorhabditis remanei]|uniref:Uncharacterized protein n=1 Tax=Caenorhabditis remanei TaxID=31234 RepID=A0A6A5G6K3_CAERE|nr:hypothetical protein GCK72_016665 [Caenorhabditis remanei]KAF1750119.1 hypothetical protein GCK72_016665 [Caenorhabditis remanei]
MLSLSLKAMTSTTEASTALNHRVDQIVHKVESGFQLASRGSSGVRNHFTASHIQQGFHCEILSGWLVTDARGEGGVDDIDPIVDRGNHLFLDLGCTDVDLVGGSNSEPTASGKELE